jgi:hypothetical protein
MGGITEVDRGVCEAPRRQGLADPAFLAAMQSRMERIVLLKDRYNVRRELWDDVEAGNRAGRVGSSVARANLAGAGSRQFDNEEEQLLYLRFTLQMELEDDHPATLPGGYYEGAAIDPDWIASAMVAQAGDGKPPLRGADPERAAHGPRHRQAGCHRGGSGRQRNRHVIRAGAP